jgi:hypothetical protein
MPLDKKGKPILYKPWVNKTKSKNKYWVYVKSDTKKGFKRIGFGHKDYEQFKDKLGFYKSKDHGDPVRRKSYLARAKGIKDKQGNLTWKDKNTSNYWAVKILW